MENKYQLSRIHNYVHGLMSREDMHALERESLEDPLLQDAIDGYSIQKGVDTRQLSILQRRLAERIDVRNAKKNAQHFTWQRLAIASVAGVMFLVACTLIFMRYFPSKNSIKLTEVEMVQKEGYSISLVPQNKNNQPFGGWKLLEEKINNRFSTDLVAEIELTIEVTAKEGRQPVDIHIQSNRSTTKLEIENIKQFILQEGAPWPIGKTNFVVKISKSKFD